MGCASSTPMIATAGSEMLKAASHVAEDATKSAEGAVSDVTQTLGKTLDTAKENVGTAVTGIAHDLGNAFKEKTDALDDAKNSLMGKLHLGTGTTNGADAEAGSNVSEEDSDKTATTIEQEMEERTSRAPTPAHDVDSLKTSTPEPEIEQALANSNEESTPPSPEPTLAELEQLTAEITTTAKTITTTTTTTVVKDITDAEPLEKPIGDSEENRRPSTTEWEKYADTLSHNRKYNPNDRFKRGGKFNRFGPQMNPPYHDYSKTPAAMNRLRDDDSGMSDQYYNSHSSPFNSNRSSATHTRRGRLPRTLTQASTKKFQREFASLVGQPLRAQSKSPAVGRKFDFNPNRSRLGTITNHVTAPLQTRSLSRSRPSSPIKSRLHSRSRVGSPIKTKTLPTSRVGSPRISRSHSRVNSLTKSSSRISLTKSSSTLARSRANSPPLQSIIAPVSATGSPSHVKAAGSLSRSSRSSTNNSLIIQSSRTSPISREQSKTSLNDSGLLSSTPSRIDRIRSRSPCMDFSHMDRVTSLNNMLSSRSPSGPMNTSSFLSSPRCSPFSIRKDYSEFSDKENKSVFITDLSSVTDYRNLPTTSPYKIRERCSVCYKKYVIK